MKLLTVICAYCLPAFMLGASGVDFRQYRSLQSYEIRPGILIMPVYSADGEVCEVSIEKRHYSNRTMDLDAEMSKDQIQALFDEIAPQKERGQPALKLPEGAEVTDVDGGIRTTRILYEKVFLTMYGRAESQKFVAATITWKKQHCGGE
jgi:hypothetical protein